MVTLFETVAEARKFQEILSKLKQVEANSVNQLGLPASLGM